MEIACAEAQMVASRSRGTTANGDIRVWAAPVGGIPNRSSSDAR